MSASFPHLWEAQNAGGTWSLGAFAEVVGMWGIRPSSCLASSLPTQPLSPASNEPHRLTPITSYFLYHSFIYFILHIWVLHPHVCICTTCVPGALRGQRSEEGFNQSAGWLGTCPRTSLQEPQMLLTSEPSLQPQFLVLKSCFHYIKQRKDCVSLKHLIFPFGRRNVIAQSYELTANQE